MRRQTIGQTLRSRMSGSCSRARAYSANALTHNDSQDRYTHAHTNTDTQLRPHTLTHSLTSNLPQRSSAQVEKLRHQLAQTRHEPQTRSPTLWVRPRAKHYAPNMACANVPGVCASERPSRSAARRADSKLCDGSPAWTHHASVVRNNANHRKHTQRDFSENALDDVTTKKTGEQRDENLVLCPSGEEPQMSVHQSQRACKTGRELKVSRGRRPRVPVSHSRHPPMMASPDDPVTSKSSGVCGHTATDGECWCPVP